jgi:hypothetical protein
MALIVPAYCLATVSANSSTSRLPAQLKSDDNHNNNGVTATLTGELSVVYDFQRDHCFASRG